MFAEATARLSPRLLRKERIRQGTMLYVEETTGRRLATTEDRFSSRRATSREAELLAVPRGSALLCGEHRVLDRSGAAVEYSESVRPGGAWTETFTRAVRP